MRILTSILAIAVATPVMAAQPRGTRDEYYAISKGFETCGVYYSIVMKSEGRRPDPDPEFGSLDYAVTRSLKLADLYGRKAGRSQKEMQREGVATYNRMMKQIGHNYRRLDRLDARYEDRCERFMEWMDTDRL